MCIANIYLHFWRHYDVCFKRDLLWMRHFQTLNSHLGYIMIAMTSVDMSGAVTVANISLSYGWPWPRTIRLPFRRLLFLYNFWRNLLPRAKYGIDVLFSVKTKHNNIMAAGNNLGPDHVQVNCSWKCFVNWKCFGKIFYKNFLQFTLLVVNHVLWVNSIAVIKSHL